MNSKTRKLVVAVTVVGPWLLVPASAAAYGGPGSIISGIGAFVAVVAALIASIFGFLWFPLKRLVRRFRGNPGDQDTPGQVGDEFVAE